MTRAARAALALAYSAAIAQPALAQKHGNTAHLSSRQPAERLRSSSTTALRRGWQPQVKGFVHHHNRIHNNWRFENVWLNK